MTFLRPSSLFPNPQKPLLYSLKLNLQNGEEISVSDPSAVRAMITLMDMEAGLRGAATHFGGPFAFCELMASCFAYMFYLSGREKKKWYEMFHFVNDAGHCENGLYALKANYQMIPLGDLKKFRSIESVLTGHGESHLFPEGVLLSNGPLGSAFSASEGLALADFLSQNERVTVTAISDGACMEGETKEALASIPGFCQKKKLNPYLLIISDNNTKLSGRIDEESFSMEPSFNSLEELGWKVIDLKKGNSLPDCLKAMEDAFLEIKKNPYKPVAIHAKTLKGSGIKEAEKSFSGAHGFPLKNTEGLKAYLEEIYHSKEVPEFFLKWTHSLKKKEEEIGELKRPLGKREEKAQKGISRALISQKEKGAPLICLSSDLPGSTGVMEFRKKFPESSFDFGVAESNMISVASGLSKMGYLPIVDTFSQFGVTKGALPLIMANLSENPMVCIFSHTGFQDAADGASHQCLHYFSALGSIAHLKTYAPATSEESEALLNQAIKEFSSLREKQKRVSSYVFFLGRETFPYSIYSKKYELGRSQIVFESLKEKNVTLLSSGPLTHECLKASKILLEKNIGSIIVNASAINEPDTKTLKKALEKTQGYLLSVEDHQVQGGLGSSYCLKLKQQNISFKIKSLGIQGEFGRSAYQALDLYQAFGLDSQHISDQAISFLDT